MECTQVIDLFYIHVQNHRFIPLGPEQNAILQTTFLNAFSGEKFCILIWISPKFGAEDPIDNKSTLSQWWHRSLTQYGVTKSQWVKFYLYNKAAKSVLRSDCFIATVEALETLQFSIKPSILPSTLEPLNACKGVIRSKSVLCLLMPWCLSISHSISRMLT